MAGGSISGVLPSLGDVGATRRHRAHGDQAAKPHPRPRVLARAPAEARADLLYAIVGLEVRSAGCGARADPGPPRLSRSAGRYATAVPASRDRNLCTTVRMRGRSGITRKQDYTLRTERAKTVTRARTGAPSGRKCAAAAHDCTPVDGANGRACGASCKLRPTPLMREEAHP